MLFPHFDWGFKSWGVLTALVLFTVCQYESAAGSQSISVPSHSHQLRYKLIVFGTFGGPSSSLGLSFIEGSGNRDISDAGTFIGFADGAPDPFCFFDDCFYPVAFTAEDGVVTKLRGLPRSHWTVNNWITDNGLIAGSSENGVIDPLSGLPEVRALLWRRGGMEDLGTIEGGFESGSFAVNSDGEVVGFATNAIRDPFSFFPPTQTRAFRWRHGVMSDLGTLGGPDAWAFYVNDRGQIAGQSYTSNTPNANNGSDCPNSTNAPTDDPFLWDERRGMSDIGSFGGTCGIVNDLNNRGEVVGLSNLAGNTIAHPFLYSHGALIDLRTFGGDNGVANWINDESEVAGSADFAGNRIHHAFLWSKGTKIDLGTVGNDLCSRAKAVNSQGQVVGGSGDCNVFLHAYLSDAHSPMIDLNMFVPPGSDITLTEADYINDQGDIAGQGVLPNGNVRAYLLVACDSDRSRECDSSYRAPGFAPIMRHPTAGQRDTLVPAQRLLRL